MQGSCLCGTVAFALEGPLEIPHHCHCGMCRKAHGADFATLASVDPSRFRVLRGEDAIRRYESSSGTIRPFCGRCGSTTPLSWSDGKVMVPYGLLEDDPDAPPAAHIYAASRPPWSVLDPAIPAYDVLPEGYPVPEVPPRPEPEPAPGAIRGGCLCGAVRFVVEGAPKLMRHCHCSRCRRGRAAAFATNLYTAAGAVRFLRGEERVASFEVPEAKHFTQCFCDACGSPLPRIDPVRDVAVIPGGALDDDPGLRPTSHIFVGSKAPWAVIADDLPQYGEYETT